MNSKRRPLTPLLTRTSWITGSISIVVAAITAVYAFNFGKDIASLSEVEWRQTRMTYPSVDHQAKRPLEEAKRHQAVDRQAKRPLEEAERRQAERERLLAETERLLAELKKSRHGASTHQSSPASIKLSTASGPTPSTDLGGQVQANAVQLADVSARLQKLEQAILATPAKALEIPLIRRDIETIKQAQVASAAALNDSVDRVYDQTKWLLGGVSISILALGLSTVLRPKASPK